MSTRILAALLSLSLASTACDGTGPRRTEILWDTWGVPHIYGADHAELFRAFGWAQMESHGDLILRLYGQARGRAAEYWGREQLESDWKIHLGGVPALAARWYEAQTPAFRGYLDAFAAGVNQYAEAHADRIADDVEVVLPITGTDLLAHTLRIIHFTFVASPRTAGVADFGRMGSNTWAIGPSRSASGHAMLLANPHLPWRDLYLFYEAHLVGPDVNLYGTTLVGTPVLLIGFNDHLGWSHTVNYYDGADAYELTPAPGGYLLDGEVRAFDETTVALRIKESDGTLRERLLTVRRSAHGPVVAERNGRPIALRTAGLDAPGILEQWWDMGRAQNLEEFEAALRRLQVPMFTVMYADREGNILHLFGGRVPKRNGGDFEQWLQVADGSSSDNLWTETHPYQDLPRVLNPESGWLQNANDPPWTTTFPPALDPDDYPAYMSPRNMAFRPQRSARMLDEDDEITWEEFIAYKHSSRMELADRLLDDLIPAARASGRGLARRAADVLDAWDRETDADSRGAPLFLAWIQEVGFSEALFAKPWSWEFARTTPDGLADPQAAVGALEDAARGVERMHGQLDIAWGDVYRLRLNDHDFPANGGPGTVGIFRNVSFGRDERGFYANGGDSYVAVTEFATPVRARVLLSYGNATQSHSKHIGDQLELFSKKQLRPAWRTRAEIEANLETRTEFDQ